METKVGRKTRTCFSFTLPRTAWAAQKIIKAKTSRTRAGWLIRKTNFSTKPTKKSWAKVR